MDAAGQQVFDQPLESGPIERIAIDQGGDHRGNDARQWAGQGGGRHRK